VSGRSVGLARSVTARVALAVALLPLAGCTTAPSDRRVAPSPQIVAGLKEALQVAADRSIAQTSRDGGFRDDSKIRLRLPGALATMCGALEEAGMKGQAGALELAMNRAAERAAGQARAPFHDAIDALEILEPTAILNGPDDAATSLLRGQSGRALHRRLVPVVDDATRQVGLAQAYAQLVGHYRRLDPAAAPPTSLAGPMTTHILDGLFTVLAREERRIRRDPAARPTPLLQSVFGAAKH